MSSKAKERGRTAPPDDRVHISYLIPRDLRDKLKASAALNRRSVEEHVIDILEDAVGHIQLTPRLEASASV